DWLRSWRDKFHARRSKLEIKRSCLIRIKEGHQFTVGDCRRANRLFLTVDLARGGDRRRESQPNIIGWFSVHFYQPNDELVAQLCLLKCHHSNAIVIQFE